MAKSSASSKGGKPALKKPVSKKPARPAPTPAPAAKSKPAPAKAVATKKSAPALKAPAKPEKRAVRDEPVRIVEAVRTGEAPRKNQAGLSSKDLEHFRQLLLEKRREIVGDMQSMESEALRSSGGTNLSTLPLHMADMGTDNYEQEFTLGLVEKDRDLLREINTALAKIQNGTYGICEGTGKPIAKVRLEAQPWARFSIEHARSLERRMRGG